MTEPACKSPHLVYLRLFPCVSSHLSAKMDSSKEAYGYLHHLLWGDAPSLLTSKEPFFVFVHGRSS